MYYNDSKSSHLSVNFRVYDKSSKKAKNDYFLDMFDEFITWGDLSLRGSPMIVSIFSEYSQYG